MSDSQYNDFVGGGGVRFSWTEEEKRKFDAEAFKVLEGRESAFWFQIGSGKQRFEPAELYKSGIYQLDHLLPHLPKSSTPSGTRTITVRLPQLPSADASYTADVIRNGRKEGRAELSIAYKGWSTAWGAATDGLWIVADFLSRRVVQEGWVISEEWWDIRDSIVQYVVKL